MFILGLGPEVAYHVYYGTPSIIKAKYFNWIEKYLNEDNAFKNFFTAEDRKLLIDDIASGIQVPNSYATNYLFNFISVNNGILTIRYDLRDEFKRDTFVLPHDEFSNFYHLSFDPNRVCIFQGKKYSDIVTEAFWGHGFWECFREIPQTFEDTIIIIDDTTSIFIKSISSIKKDIREVFGSRSICHVYFEPYNHALDSRVFSIVNGEIFNLGDDECRRTAKYQPCKVYNIENESRSLFAEHVFFNTMRYNFPNMTCEGIRENMKRRIMEFTEKFFTIPDSCKVIRIEEIEKEFISSL